MPSMLLHPFLTMFLLLNIQLQMATSTFLLRSSKRANLDVFASESLRDPQYHVGQAVLPQDVPENQFQATSRYINGKDSDGEDGESIIFDAVSIGSSKDRSTGNTADYVADSKVRGSGGDNLYRKSGGAPGSGSRTAVLPGQTVAAFCVDTPLGPFCYDPATSELPVVVMVFNPQDPFQRAMWSAWSLQMFLRHAPLAAADYLFVPYTYSSAAAADVAYYMYREMITAARVVYGSNETTDEDLRKRVLSHIHFSTTPATSISPQFLLLLNQWSMDMKVLHARLARAPPSAVPSAAAVALNVETVVATNHISATAATAEPAVAEPATDGLTVGRLDAWYGWLPSPATVSPNPAPLVAFEAVSRGAEGVGIGVGVGGKGFASAGTMRSPCDPSDVSAAAAASPAADGSLNRRDVDTGGGGSGIGGRFAGAWVVVSNATREGHPSCSYSDIIVNLQRNGALGVIFAASPGRDVEVITPADPEFSNLDGKAVYERTIRNFYGWGNSWVRHQSSEPLGRRPLATCVGRGHNSVGELNPEMSASQTHSMFKHRRAASTSDSEGGTSSGGVKEENLVEDGDADVQPCVPATMVSYTDGLDLMTLLGNAARDDVTAEVEIQVTPIPTGWFVIDPWIGLAEAGWAQLPVMMHAGWAAWWHVYLKRLRSYLRDIQGHSPRSHVVDIFQDLPFPGPHGAVASAVLPRHLHRRGHFQRVLLDFSLGCRGPMDSSCPAWDHMVQLFACCDPQPERCPPCPTTLWKQQPLKTSAATAAPPLQRCGLELGRWATPFRRRVGRWLTDATPLMGLLGAGGRCSFTVQTAPWADGNWTATLSLIFVRKGAPVHDEQEEDVKVDRWSGGEVHNSMAAKVRTPPDQETRRGEPGGAESHEEGEGEIQHHLLRHHRNLAVHPSPKTSQRIILTATGSAVVEATAAQAANGVTAKTFTGTEAITWLEDPLHHGLRPFVILPLFDSATFDGSYNRDRAVVTIPTPNGARAATIVSYITGHGFDAETGCCEFYPTSHHIFVNGLEVAILNFTEAGTTWGCADAVLYGGVPNQHGTWFYGRGGWCDGAAVKPWVVDVSRMLWPPGSKTNNTIRYKGLYGDGQEPSDPLEGSSAGYIMMQALLVLYE